MALASFNPARRRLLQRDRPLYRPPWALPEERFVASCTRCDGCIDRCPEGILVRGAGGFPELDFGRGGCLFCGDCLQACEAGALASTDPVPETAWSLRASIDERCLSAQGVVCRTCGDLCETGAIRFRLQPGGRALPELDRGACTGCGACLAVCPAQAITLTSPREEISHE